MASLRWYRRPRMVVLHPQAPVMEAARAMENNEIGAILVQHKGELVGIVTDRDIAVRATGHGLDPKTTPISAVMSEGVVTLSIDSPREEALNLMKTRNIRRVPLMDGDSIAGLVTVDDLLLDETASLDDVSEVVEAQLGSGGPAASPRSPAAQRSAARAEATYRRMIRELQWAAELSSFEQTETATEVIVSGILQRLQNGDAQSLLAQLPSLLRERLGALPSGPDTSLDYSAIASNLASTLDIEQDRAAELVSVIGAQLLGFVSSGQAQKVRGQLPPDLRDALQVVSGPPPA